MAQGQYYRSVSNSDITNKSLVLELNGSVNAIDKLDSVQLILPLKANRPNVTATIGIAQDNNISGWCQVTCEFTQSNYNNYVLSQNLLDCLNITCDKINDVTMIFLRADVPDGNATIYVDGTQYIYVDYSQYENVISPTSFTVSTTKTTSASTTVAWSGAQSGNGNAISGYEIQYQDSTNNTTWGNWTVLKNITSSFTSGNTSVNLPSPRNYRRFRIKALGTISGYDATTYQVSSSVLRTASPTTPSGLTVTPTEWESGAINISWNASSATGQTIVAYYLEYRLQVAGGSYGNWLALTDTTNTIYSYTPVIAPGDKMQYRVRAYSSDGYYSSYSATATLTAKEEQGGGEDPGGEETSSATVYVGISNLSKAVRNIFVGIDGVAHEIVEGYVGVNGVAKLFYQAHSSLEYIYSGTYTVSEQSIDGVDYVILTLTSSGVLTVSRTITTDIWMCGGGGNGGDTSQSVQGGGGGGGGYINSISKQLSGNTTCIIGTAAGVTSLGTTIANAGGNGSGNNGGNGASGGGSGGTLQAPGTGEGVSTIPAGFGVSNAHCAGGGGGSGMWSGFQTFSGGVGGSNGANGGNNIAVSSGPAYGGSGGEKGGGGGGLCSNSAISMNNGGNATYYGSGGGGGGSYVSSEILLGTGGSGYQGVVYIRWKKEDMA